MVLDTIIQTLKVNIVRKTFLRSVHTVLSRNHRKNRVRRDRLCGKALPKSCCIVCLWPTSFLSDCSIAPSWNQNPLAHITFLLHLVKSQSRHILLVSIKCPEKVSGKPSKRINK